MRRISAFHSPINIQAVALLTLTFILSVQRAAAASVALSASLTRKIPFKYQGDTYQTWTSVYGGLSSTPNRPLYVRLRRCPSSFRSTHLYLSCRVVVHGGPGLTHDYLLPLRDLSSTRPVIFYDQIGSGRSTHLKTKPDSFFTIELFLAELDNLLTTLGVSEDYDFFGHSWGGVMGSELAVTKPSGLNKLILSDSLPSVELWSESHAQQMAEFPKEVQEGLVAGFDDAPKYRAAIEIFYAKHGCTVNPWPKEMNVSFDYLFDDPTVNIEMSV